MGFGGSTIGGWRFCGNSPVIPEASADTGAFLLPAGTKPAILIAETKRGTDMDTLWLEHYCHADCEPLKNIMRLPEAEAFHLAKRMAQEHPQTTAFYRFADFENYYPRRLKTDALLYAQFCALGGKPQAEHPLSFVLGSSAYLHHWFGEGRVIRLPVDSVPEDMISFTLGDSMSTLDKRGSLTMLTLSMLKAQFAHHPEGAAGWLRDRQAEYHYIEVQVWGDVSLAREEI